MADTLISAFSDSLGLVSGWEISRVTTDRETRRIDLYVSYVDRTLVSPETGELGGVYDHRKERIWRHLDIVNYTCFVHCRIPRVKSSAGVKTVEVPWAATSKSYTYEFERWGIDALQATKSQTAASKLLRCSFDMVNRILHGSVARGMHRRTLEDVEELSVDEKAFQRGHTYVFNFFNHSSIYFIHIPYKVQGDKEAWILLCRRVLGEQVSGVRVLTSDMWKGYLALHKALLSHAALIHDRFHLMQYLTKSQDKVRRREVKRHPEILKNSRYALLKNERESHGHAGGTLSEHPKSELRSQCRLALTSRVQRPLRAL